MLGSSGACWARGSLAAKFGQQLRVDAVGFGALGAGFGKVPHARRFDNGHREVGLMQRGDDALLITTGSFADHEQRLGKRFELRDQAAMARRGIGQGEVEVLEVYLERAFGNIQSDI